MMYIWQLTLGLSKRMHHQYVKQEYSKAVLLTLFPLLKLKCETNVKLNFNVKLRRNILRRQQSSRLIFTVHGSSASFVTFCKHVGLMSSMHYVSTKKTVEFLFIVLPTFFIVITGTIHKYLNDNCFCHFCFYWHPMIFKTKQSRFAIGVVCQP